MLIDCPSHPGDHVQCSVSCFPSKLEHWNDHGTVMAMVMVTVVSRRGEDHGSENDGQLLADPHGLVLTCSMVHGPKFSTQSAPRIQTRTWPPWKDKPQSLGALGRAPTNPFPTGPGRRRGPLAPRPSPAGRLVVICATPQRPAMASSSQSFN